MWAPHVPSSAVSVISVVDLPVDADCWQELNLSGVRLVVSASEYAPFECVMVYFAMFGFDFKLLMYFGWILLRQAVLIVLVAVRSLLCIRILGVFKRRAICCFCFPHIHPYWQCMTWSLVPLILRKYGSGFELDALHVEFSRFEVIRTFNEEAGNIYRCCCTRDPVNQLLSCFCE